MPEVKKEFTKEIVQEYEVSITRACQLMMIYRSYFYYETKKDDSLVRAAIQEHCIYGDGFWEIYARLRQSGKPWNHKRVYRVYKSMCYNKRSKLKKRLPARLKHPLVTPEHPNHTWSIDFVSDALNTGRKFCVLNVLDDFDRSSVA
jgi:putative transposase